MRRGQPYFLSLPGVDMHRFKIVSSFFERFTTLGIQYQYLDDQNGPI